MWVYVDTIRNSVHILRIAWFETGGENDTLLDDKEKKLKYGEVMYRHRKYIVYVDTIKMINAKFLFFFFIHFLN